MRRHRRQWAWMAATALLLGTAACSVLVDHSATQCQSDGDCARFGSHPVCQAGVCVSSGLGPTSCFYGTPQQPQDFLNQCGTAACLSFDDCQRLQLCGGATDMDAALVSPPAPQSSATSDAGEVDSAAPSLPLCQDPNNGRGQVVVLTGSSNFPPLLAKLAPLVLATGYTPVYLVTNSCSGVKAAFGGGSDQMVTDPVPGPSAKYAAFFQQDGSSVTCSLGPTGLHVDIGESDIFSTTCDGYGPPSGSVGEYLGPIEAMAFVVPGQSSETAISADAARAVFGMGGAGGLAAPWTDPTLYFVRNANTGTQQEIGHAIGVPGGSFWGEDRGSAANVDALMKTISDPTLADEAIGIISVDYYDADRANLKALAFSADGQTCAYLPDSTAFKKDKQNVRDGHYPIWGPLHFFTAINDGIPTSAGAQAFVSVVSVPNIPQSLLDAFIGASLVPSCAMSVQRTSELGPLSTYSAPFQCGCYFEASPAVNGAAPAGCAPCTTGNDCNDPTHPACNLGYCEIQ